MTRCAKMHVISLFLTVLVFVVADCALQNVFEFDTQPADDVESLLMTFLMRSPQKKHKSIYHSGTLPLQRLKNFKFKDCGGKYATVTDLTLQPDPVQFPGQINVSAKGIIKKEIGTPLTASLNILKKDARAGWIKIPCIAGIGSCTYKDVCLTLEDVTCPDILTEHGIPCKCPFKPKAYSFPLTSFQVDATFLLSGEYYIVGQVKQNNDLAACVNFNATIG